MSVVKIRAALETALDAMTPALSTAWENQAFAPVAETPYQSVFVLFAEPNNPVKGNSFTQEAGIFQVNLNYPLGVGSGDANTRAELIKATFYRGRQFTYSGVTVTIERTPNVAPGGVEEDRFVLPVKIRFFANISNS